MARSKAVKEMTETLKGEAGSREELLRNGDSEKKKGYFDFAH
jgi:hypothetical protein